MFRMLGCAVVLLAVGANAHDGPDPVARWEFHERNVREGVLRALVGPDARVVGKPEPIREIAGQSWMMDGRAASFDVLEPSIPIDQWMPKRTLTAEAWVAVNTPQGYGGIVGYFQDNGGFEKGWVLGYDDRAFTLGLASTGADDGDGKMTYLAAKTPYELGRMYHVVGTYDGETMCLYVNGKLEATSKEQRGEILYPERAKLHLGAYRDDDENNLHHGRLHEVVLYDLAATDTGVEHLFEHKSDLAQGKAVIQENPNFEWIVQPYQQYPTPESIRICFELSRSGTAEVFFGKSDADLKSVTSPSAPMHHVLVEGLEPDGHYVFKVVARDDQGRQVESELLTFRTAPDDLRPIRFGVVGDTQDQPHVNTRIAEWMWAQRPDFFMIPGDLVGTGANKTHWVEHFFGSMRPLLSRVPLIPVLGNHEGDARLYYDYMSVPEPEYYYSFRYGPAEIFVVDSQRNVGPDSDQYKWLVKALEESDAPWKFVAHHYPPFSSDEDDYGNRWKGQSVWGDLRIRQLAEIYERFDVDIVWTGHIHSYERTWPIRQMKQDDSGVIYIVCGGGGGGLETPAPTRPWFSNTIRYGHHFCMVSLTETSLEFKAYDVEGRLFDTFVLKKEAKR